jgi:hypothetical protein
MGTKQKPSPHDAYEKAEVDEPMFVLLARDPIAPLLVEEWARIRRDGLISDAPATKAEQERTREKVAEAYECAEAMRMWRERNRS